MDTDDLIEPGTGDRTASELATLLLELGRIVKARRFYGAGDSRLAPIFERGLRTWRADLERRGCLDLEIQDEGFREHAGRGLLSHVKLAELHRDLIARGVRRVRFAADIDADAMAAFAEVLASEAGDLEARGGFASLLYARVPEGILVNGGAPETPSPPAPAPEPVSAPASPAPLDSLSAASLPEPVTEPTPEPPGETQLELAQEPLLDLSPEPTPALETTLGAAPEEPLAAQPDTLGEEMPEELEFLDDAPRREAPDAASAFGPPLDEDTDPLELADEAPFDHSAPLLHPDEKQAADAKPRERAEPALATSDLGELLRELESCEDVASYLELARQVGRHAEQASEAKDGDTAYRVLVALAGQAAGKDNPRLSDVAQSFLSSLVQGPRLKDLVERACAPSQGESVRASQILLQVGEPVVRPLLDAADGARDAARRGHLHGVLIAMGEKILPELLRRMAEEENLEAVKNAIRLTGETQNPEGVPRLNQLLAHPNASVREEAAKALVRVGSERAIDALIRSLRSKTPGLPELAIYCLGATGQERAVVPLVQTLQEAVEERQVERGREVIRALGRLGRPAATSALAELLLRKSVMGRRGLRDLKLAAATVLGGLPGDEAVGALAQAARSRDPQLRRAAQTALDRRAHAFARSSGTSGVRTTPGVGH